MASKKNHSLKDDFISRLSDNKQHLIALAVLFILPVILYSSIFLGDKRFLGNDIVQWRAGAESVIEYNESHDGEHPLWASNMFSGMPSYVVHAPQAVPNIDTLIRSLSGDTHPLPYFWVLLGGAYLLFVLMGSRPLTAVVGSILIAFSTYFPIIIEAGHYTKFVAYAYIPWVLVGYWLITRSDKKLLAFFVFALALALELRANHPQVLYYFIYLLGFWWIYDTYKAHQNDELKDWLSKTAFIAGAGVLAIVSSLESYWRLYEYSQFSTRGGSTLDVGAGSGLSLDYAFRWSQGIGELLTLIIPGLYGGSSAEAYWGPKPFTSGPHYLGAIAFILALFGLIYYRKKIKWLFFGVGTLTLLFSLGEHFRLLNEFMFSYVPFFSKFRTPEMWLIVTVFCYAVLAIFGLQSLFRLTREKKNTLKPLFVPLGIAIMIGIIFALGSDALLSFEKPGERQQYAQQVAQNNNVSPSNPQVQQAVNNFINTRLKPERKELAGSDSVRYLILVLLASGLIYLFYRQKLSKGYFLLALILLVSYDMLSIAERYVNEDQLVSDDFDTERYIEQRKRPIDEFLMENIDSGEGYPWRVFPLMDNPFNNAVPAYFYPSIGGYTGAKLAHYQDLIDSLLMTGPQGIHMPILDMLNVKYITIGQQLPFDNLRQVYQNQNRYVYENTDVLSKAFYVDSVITVGSPRQAVSQMKPGSGFAPDQYAVVETEEPIIAQKDTAESLSVITYNAKEIVLETERTNQGFLVISEIYYPAGWKASIDGESTPIYKTNFVLRGLQVPAGEHTIKMTFEPQSDVWGGRFAWMGHILIWLTGIGAIVLYRRKQKRK